MSMSDSTTAREPMDRTTSNLPPPVAPTYAPPTRSEHSAPARGRRSLQETKLSFLTTEFWAMVAGIVALIVLYNTTDNPDMTLWRTCLLATVIGVAYIASRGWAKSGSHSDHWESDHR